MFNFSGRRPENLGMAAGRFAAPATRKPNWVSSQAEATADREHYIAPLAYFGAADQAMAKLQQILAAIARVEVIKVEPDYLYAQFTSGLMGYVDDVEFYCDGKAIQVRSSSRLGYSDLGANRKRVETLRAALVG